MDRGMKCRTIAAALLLAFAAAGETPARTYKKGEVVTIGGRVTDAGGQPLADVSVVLEVSRRAFDLLRFWQPKEKRQKTDLLRVPTATDPDGSYSFEWRWDPYYDTFELAVALPVTKGGEDAFEVFHRRDVTADVGRGGPVTVALQVEDTGYLEWLRRFLAGQASDDEKRVYRDMGRPDRVDSAERSAGTEVSWWYFEAGKVYRFVGGRLDQVVPFDPVPPVE